jgi:hypothetical protein
MTALLELFGLGEEGLNNVKSFLESFRANPLHDMKEAILFSSRLRSSSIATNFVGTMNEGTYPGNLS